MILKSPSYSLILLANEEKQANFYSNLLDLEEAKNSRFYSIRTLCAYLNSEASHLNPGLFFRHLSQNWAIPKLRICPKLRQNWLKLSLFFPKLRFSEIFCNLIFTSENCIFWFSSIFIVLNTSILCDIKVLLDIFDCIRSIALDNQHSTQFWPKLRKFWPKLRFSEIQFGYVAGKTSKK